MARLGAVLLVSAFAGVASAATALSDDDPPATTTVTVTTAATVTVTASYRGRPARIWARRFRRRTQQLQQARAATERLHRTLLQQPSTIEAINLSCAVYGSCTTLWRKADCETGGTFSPTAHNSSGASGLFQFLPSTWRTTPFARFSIWSPYANALAAGWMHEQGRGSEWECR